MLVAGKSKPKEGFFTVFLTTCVLFSMAVWGKENGEVFELSRDGNFEIYSADRTRLTDNPAQDRFPAVSQDGNKIVFSSDRDGNFEIYVMDYDGKNKARLTQNPGRDIHPTWSSGDSLIVFVSDRDGVGNLFTMNIDGSNQKVLDIEKAREIEYDPTWDSNILGPDYRPTAWLHPKELGRNKVRLFLDGTRDREDGKKMSGKLSFGDATDTTFTHIPAYIDHLFPDEGSYKIILQVEDSSGQEASVSLDLILKIVLDMQRPDIEYERGYKSKPLDR